MLRVGTFLLTSVVAIRALGLRLCGIQIVPYPSVSVWAKYLEATCLYGKGGFTLYAVFVDIQFHIAKIKMPSCPGDSSNMFCSELV